jgi:ABC-type sugar transport system substrate-binding protein
MLRLARANRDGRVAGRRTWLGGLALVAGCGLFSAPAPTGQVSVGSATGDQRVDAHRYLDHPVSVTRPWRLVFAAKDAVPPEGDDSFWGRSWLSMQSYAASRGATIRLVPTACMTCIDDQISKLESLLAEGEVDGLILGPVDSVHLAPVVDKVVEAGIPTLAYDTPVDSTAVLSLVSVDNLATGRAVGEWVVKRLGGTGRVAMLNGPWGHDNALQRRTGIMEGLEHGRVRVVASQPARWKRHLAEDEVRRWLAKSATLDAIVAANDEMALGALDALEGTTPRPLVTGFDGDPEAVAAVRAGRLDLTVQRDAEAEGRAAVEVMLRHLETKMEMPRLVMVSAFRLLDQERLAAQESAGLAHP